MENLNPISAQRGDSAAEQGARPVSGNGSAFSSAPRQLSTGAQVIDNVKRTRAYFASLRSPTSHLEQRIAGLAKMLQECEQENARLNATIAQLRGKLFFYEDPATVGRVSIRSIQTAVAEHYNLSLTEMLSERRTGSVVGPRQVAMYLAKILTTASYPEIGRCFGNRDHTTVLHACRTVLKRSEFNQDLKAVVNLLRDKLLCQSRSA